MLNNLLAALIGALLGGTVMTIIVAALSISGRKSLEEDYIKQKEINKEWVCDYCKLLYEKQELQQKYDHQQSSAVTAGLILQTIKDDK